MKTATEIKKNTRKKSLKKATATEIVPEFDPTAIEDPTDPRRIAFSNYYLNPQSPYFRNGLQSAIKAGFTEAYSRNIIANRPQWLCDIVAQLEKFDFVAQARKNIAKFINLKTLEPVISMFGPVVDKETGAVLMKENAKLLKIQQDTTHFVLEKLDKDFEEKQKDPMVGNTVNIEFNYYQPGTLQTSDKPKKAKVVDPEQLIKEVHASAD